MTRSRVHRAGRARLLERECKSFQEKEHDPTPYRETVDHVVGAASKQGRSVAHALLDSGRYRVRALTRRRMRPWAKAAIADYRRLSLRAHNYFSDVPIYDVWRVELPGLERSCTMLDVRATVRAMAKQLPPNLAVRSLFALRRLLGFLFHWDAPSSWSSEWSWRRRLAASDLEASTVPTGTHDGPFSVLYVHDTEAVSEIRNRTVQAFLVFAIEPAPDGHTLYFAIHVLSVSAWTRPYLACIKPFRLWIVYPSLLRRLHETWCRRLSAA